MVKGASLFTLINLIGVGALRTGPKNYLDSYMGLIGVILFLSAF
jgi:hypothetical protein